MGCVSASVYAPKTPCSELVPASYRDYTEHTPPPELGVNNLETFKNWVSFALAQTAKVANSDDKRISSLEIIERCEKRDMEAIEEVKDGGFLGLG